VHYRPVPGSVFLWLAVVVGMAAALQGRGRVWRAPLAGVAIAVTAGTSVAMNTTWASAERVWTQAMQYGGNSRARLGLLFATGSPNDTAFTNELDAIVDSEIGALGLGAANTRVLDRAALHDTSRAASHFGRAYVAKRAGDSVLARAESYAAARAAPSIVTYQMAAMIDAQTAEDWDAVLEFAAAFAAIDPQQSVSDFASGFALQRLGRLPEAVARYERYLQRPEATTSVEGREQVRVNLIVALAQLGRCVDAEPTLRVLEEQRPVPTAVAALRRDCPRR